MLEQSGRLIFKHTRNIIKISFINKMIHDIRQRIFWSKKLQVQEIHNDKTLISEIIQVLIILVMEILQDESRHLNHLEKMVLYHPNLPKKVKNT